MKMFLQKPGILIAAAAFIAVPTAIAQSSSSDCYGCTPSTQTQTTQTPMSQIPQINVTVDGFAGSVGDFGAVFEGDSGEASTEKEGVAYAVFDILYGSCPGDGPCGPTTVTANVGAAEVGASRANSVSTTPGIGAKAWNSNTAVIGGGLQVNVPQMPAASSD